ncbi:VOC family protein [Chloroflexota bacterium]
MEPLRIDKLPFSSIDQVGVIVRDIDKAIKHYESLGIGPFKPLEGIVAIERTMRGKPANDVNNEIRGEGINHLGFFVEDIERETAKLVENGFKVIATTKFLHGGGLAYFETDSVGGVLFELIQRPTE